MQRAATQLGGGYLLVRGRKATSDSVLLVYSDLDLVIAVVGTWLFLLSDR